MVVRGVSNENLWWGAICNWGFIFIRWRFRWSWGGISNFPAIMVGSSLMISGVILGALGIVKEVLEKNHDEMKSLIGVPEVKMPKIEQEQRQIVVMAGETAIQKDPKDVWVLNGEDFGDEEGAKAANAKYRAKYTRS